VTVADLQLERAQQVAAAQKDQYLTEAGIEFKSPKKHGLIKNV
jgi:hypothetical protein